MLVSAWLVCLKFTHFAGEVEQLRAQRKPPEAVKPNRQNVWCGARVLLYSVCISAKEGGSIKQNRDLRLANLVVKQCTRTYIV